MKGERRATAASTPRIVREYRAQTAEERERLGRILAGMLARPRDRPGDKTGADDTGRRAQPATATRAPAGQPHDARPAVVPEDGGDAPAG